MTTKIQFLIADASNESRLKLLRELGIVKESHSASPNKDQFSVDFDIANPEKLQGLFRQGAPPDVVHFSGHGSGPGLIMESAWGTGQLVPVGGLAGLFELFAGKVQCVVLNACYSDEQARAIFKHVPCVIGMTHAIGDSAAESFSAGFYQALFSGDPYDQAFKFGRNRIHLTSGVTGAQTVDRKVTTGDEAPTPPPLPEHLKPVLYFRPDVYIRCHPLDDQTIERDVLGLLRKVGLLVAADLQFRSGLPAYDQATAIQQCRNVFVSWTQNWQADPVPDLNYADDRVRVLWWNGTAPPVGTVADLTSQPSRVRSVVHLFQKLAFPEDVINRLLAESVRQGINAFLALLVSPDVRVVVGRVVTNLVRVRDDLAKLNQWKTLHDQFHAISVALPGLADPYDRLMQEINKLDDVTPEAREEAIDRAWVPVQNVLRRQLLQALRPLVRSDASAFRPTQLSAYCGQLSIALGDLEKAATQTDLEALTGGIAVLEPVVDTTMVMVNTELFSTAAQVPLQVLGDELGRVAELLRSADLPASIPEPVPGLPADLPRLLPTFERGISSLRELNTRLTGLVRIHNELQLMETVTKSIEGPTVSAADIRPKWKGLRAKADLLNAIPGADWLAVLCGMIGVVNDTLQAATTNPTDRRSLSALRNAFNDFRSQLVTDFHETDTKLRQFVSDVQNIRDPVEKAIEGLKR